MIPRIVTASRRVSAVSASSTPGISNDPPERSCFSNDRIEATSNRANSGVSIPVCDQYAKTGELATNAAASSLAAELLTGFARPTSAIVRMPVVALASARASGGATPIPWINVAHASHNGEV